jgi:hypothetical protein
MKHSLLISLCAALFLLISNKTKAQTTGTKLNQMELMKQFFAAEA